MQLLPDFDNAIDLPVGMPDTLDITAVLGIGLAALAAQPRAVSLLNPAPVARWGNLQQPANWLDPIGITILVYKVN